jgi:hypothetical protein
MHVDDENLQLPRAGNSSMSEAAAIMAQMRLEKVRIMIIGYIIFNINGYPLKKPKNY